MIHSCCIINRAEFTIFMSYVPEIKERKYTTFVPEVKVGAHKYTQNTWMYIHIVNRFDFYIHVTLQKWEKYNL